MSNPETFCIVKPCGHSVAGTWSVPSTGEKGFLCWNFDKGTECVDIPWPAVLHCRYCGKDFTPEQVKKSWLEPVYFSQRDNTFNCGCHYIDSSD